MRIKTDTDYYVKIKMERENNRLFVEYISIMVRVKWGRT